MSRLCTRTLYHLFCWKLSSSWFKNKYSDEKHGDRRWVASILPILNATVQIKIFSRYSYPALLHIAFSHDHRFRGKVRVPRSQQAPILTTSPSLSSCSPCSLSTSLSNHPLVSYSSPVSWADDLGDMSPVAPHVVVLPDGTQVVVEYKINDNGKKVKVTRKIRKVLVKQRANQCIAERKVRLV